MLEILAAAAYSPSRSSKANGLYYAVPAIFGANVAEMSANFNPFGYRSSNPTTPATQSVCAARSPGVPSAMDRKLTQAEAAFRIQKNQLKVRPIWHQREDRVQAHVLVCFLAWIAVISRLMR
jgi:hypothetical protein